MGWTLRPLDPDGDVGRIAALMREYGFPGATSDGMRKHLALTPRHTRCTIVAAEGTDPEAARQGGQGGQGAGKAEGANVIGYADIYRQEGMAPGAFLLFLLVDPAARRRGVGARLYQEALGFAAAHGLREVRVPAWDSDPEGLAFAGRRGFEPEHLIVSSHLDVASFDEFHLAPLVEQVRAQGIRLFSLAEVRDTPENRRRLHELYRETWLDAPDGAGWVERMTDEFTAPLFRPESAPGLFLAATGDEWVGFTHVKCHVRSGQRPW